MYSISTVPEHRLVRITVTGLLTAGQVEQLYREEHQAIVDMGCALGDHIVLVDLRDCPIQFQEVVGAFQKNINGEGQARRLAMVTGGSAARMQARRILKRGGAHQFDTIAEAEEWLLAPEERRAA